MPEPSDATIAYARGVIDDVRNALMESYFGKHFERRDLPKQSERSREPAVNHDIHGNVHERGIDR